MRPAFSVVFLTTLTGAAQGLFLALFATELLAGFGVLARPGTAFFVAGAVLAVVLAGLGLLASFFHLGHPERAWRAIAMWRTSWLSRECIFLPAFMATVFVYGLSHWLGSGLTLAVGALATLCCFGLFVSTGMIYTCIKVLREWASPLTTTNFIFLGCASGFTLAAGLAAWTAPDDIRFLAIAAVVLTLVGCATRVASLVRNARLQPKASLQSATGIKHRQVVQKSRGFTGGAFNLKEFFHGQSEQTMRTIKWTFLVLTFPAPLALLAAGLANASAVLLAAAFAIQYAGLLAERWFFFAEAHHPQNMYYRGVS
ncbi:MAG: dimethyl sulfoxide reductase anchor subunit [Burkholderiales bacterium]|nr:dimethyl sulfoxide reductase anchor subunit [Burkholderiales bacterium]